MIQLPQLFDADMTPNATYPRLHPISASYHLRSKPLSTAELVLDGETVEQGQFVRMFDTWGSVGVFRVSKVKNTYGNSNRQYVTLEHAIVTLGDKLIFGYYEYGGSGIDTGDALDDLLALQATAHWAAGTVDYTDECQYSVENDFLLNAVIALGGPLTGDWYFELDTDEYPFEIGILEAETTPSMEVRMTRNGENIEITIDRSELRTRLYPLGYGEGVNQLTIKDVNGDVAYIDQNTGIYGVIEDTFIDTSIKDAATLMANAEAALEAYSTPKITAEVQLRDIYLLTGEPLDRPRLNALARVPIAEYGVNIEARIVEVMKDDVYNHESEVRVVLANNTEDIKSTISKLARSARIGQLYSQGSTSFVPLHFADNCDADDALVCDFYIDAQEIYINEVLCKYKLDQFRAFSKSASASAGNTGLSTAGTSGAASPDVAGITGYSDGLEGVHGHTSGTLTVQSHTHSIPQHQHTLGSHTHGLIYGIYKGTTANSVVISVDGNTVDSGDIVDGQFDAVPYLEKDVDGKITRNTWHTISFLPDQNSRIICDIQKKTFIRALSGGNY